jgi:cell cycle arrest protein BUB3
LQISSYPTSIASLAFNAQGNLLAVASSYMYEYGQRESPPDAIYIRPVQEGEVKPKPRKTAAAQ